MCRNPPSPSPAAFAPRAPWWLRRPTTPRLVFRGFCGTELAAARIAVGYALFMSGVGGYVKLVDVRRGAAPFVGWQKGASIHLRVGPAACFPIVQRYYGRAAAPTYAVADWIEALAGVAAHEMQHVVQWLSDSPPSEVEAERSAVACIRRFRRIRADLGLGRPERPTRSLLKAAAISRDAAAEAAEANALWSRHRAGPIAVRRARRRRLPALAHDGLHPGHPAP